MLPALVDHFVELCYWVGSLSDAIGISLVFTTYSSFSNFSSTAVLPRIYQVLFLSRWPTTAIQHQIPIKLQLLILFIPFWCTCTRVCLCLFLSTPVTSLCVKTRSPQISAHAFTFASHNHPPLSSLLARKTRIKKKNSPVSPVFPLVTGPPSSPMCATTITMFVTICWQLSAAMPPPPPTPPPTIAPRAAPLSGPPSTPETLLVFRLDGPSRLRLSSRTDSNQSLPNVGRLARA